MIRSLQVAFLLPSKSGKRETTMWIEITEQEAKSIASVAIDLAFGENQKNLLSIYGKYQTAKEKEMSPDWLTPTEEQKLIKESRKAIDKWESIKAAPLSYYELNKVCELVADYGIQWVLEAMDITGDNGKSRLSYTMTILNSWKTNGRDNQKKRSSTVEDLLAKWDD